MSFGRDRQSAYSRGKADCRTVSWVLQGFRGFVGFLGLGFRGVGGSFNSWVLDFKQCAQY